MLTNGIPVYYSYTKCAHIYVYIYICRCYTFCLKSFPTRFTQLSAQEMFRKAKEVKLDGSGPTPSVGAVTAAWPDRSGVWKSRAMGEEIGKVLVQLWGSFCVALA